MPVSGVDEKENLYLYGASRAAFSFLFNSQSDCRPKANQYSEQLDNYDRGPVQTRLASSSRTVRK